MIDGATANIACLTETTLDFLPSNYLISADADYGYLAPPGRRKAVLWSAEPWSMLDDRGDAELPSGRFIAGRTETPIGPIHVVGVCIPWERAHVSTGRKDRRAWEDHRAYLNGLARILRRDEYSTRTIVVGDFNQTIPRRRAPAAVAEALNDAIRVQVRSLRA
jgi:hypothetical protein